MMAVPFEMRNDAMVLPQINAPALWRGLLALPERAGNKYDRGHALIVASPDLTGATRLAAASCARVGAGLVSVVARRRADVYRATLPANIMVRDDDGAAARRVTAVLAGSGGADRAQLKRVLATFRSVHQVLDADAIHLALDGQLPCGQLRVLTPHDGEFERAFPRLKGSRVDRAMAAARMTDAIIMMKGPDTVIAAPDGKLVVNEQRCAWLATAGTGDVLAGLVAGLLAQKMPPFQACCAAAWIHADAANRFGPGLVASDIPELIPAALRDLFDCSL